MTACIIFQQIVELDRANSTLCRELAGYCPAAPPRAARIAGLRGDPPSYDGRPGRFERVESHDPELLGILDVRDRHRSAVCPCRPGDHGVLDQLIRHTARTLILQPALHFVQLMHAVERRRHWLRMACSEGRHFPLHACSMLDQLVRRGCLYWGGIDMRGVRPRSFSGNVAAAQTTNEVLCGPRHSRASRWRTRNLPPFPIEREGRGG